LLGRIDFEVYLDRLLRATTKKSQLFFTEKCTPVRMLATPMASRQLCSSVYNLGTAHRSPRLLYRTSYIVISYVGSWLACWHEYIEWISLTVLQQSSPTLHTGVYRFGEEPMK